MSNENNLTDNFRGDTSQLILSITALLDLDAAGALAPHGVGGHGRALLAAAANRLAPVAAAEQANNQIRDVGERYRSAHSTSSDAAQAPLTAEQRKAMMPTGAEVIELFQRAVKELPASLATEVWQLTPLQAAWVVGMLIQKHGAAPVTPAAAPSEDAYVAQRMTQLLAEVYATIIGDDARPEDEALPVIERVKKAAQVLRLEVDLYRAQRDEAAAAPQPALTEEQIDAVWKGMPGGHAGFCKQWGYQQFAKAIIKAARKAQRIRDAALPIDRNAIIVTAFTASGEYTPTPGAHRVTVVRVGEGSVGGGGGVRAGHGPFGRYQYRDTGPLETGEDHA